MNHRLSSKETFVVGLMLFALFFGGGNMIFPPSLGQAAGTNVWIAIIGFLITGVGLPLLGVIAIGLAGSDVQTLGSRIHPIFGIVFTIILYLAIGPLFGIPRTGTVAFEIGVTPFLTEGLAKSPLTLLIYTVVFFGLTYWLALNPSKLVDRIGKLLTPGLLAVLALLAFKAIATPMGTIQAPQPNYQEGPFFKGFLEGYLTMDTLAALVFGIVVINAVKDKGITDSKAITKVCIQAGLIAAAGLALVYLSLGYIGATSISSVGLQENGGLILSGAANELFGLFGNAVLTLAITFACLTTSVGLVSACGQYFSKILPKVSYPVITLALTLFSAVIANVGLTQLIAFSVPLLIALYPLAIVLILLSFIDKLFNRAPEVYSVSLLFTGAVSIIDGLKAAKISSPAITGWFEAYLPLFSEGIGWVVPAIAGAAIGYVISLLRKSRPEPKIKESHGKA
ncbi:branched-chain amino acid transport system II carrier protein [Bacillus mangrovi]|uniref:Branched-chain amino acid transport system carrier protein n=1 Tax=Metabacillus mangrovi TaxID=1491830 RepID=A0A7X2V3M1_9BACI|nr:branched-chain amino acid transport system II carrier protein [Metabacillus mangrovi]MTH52827.1 branched-chain amino acid transport system II carrier protein [Metabacillus mangrovi]